MRVLNAGSDIERKIYQSMSWEERGDKYYGHGILREGALILSVAFLEGMTESLFA